MLNDPDVHMSELGILDEHAGGDALLLWNLARDFTLWATTPPERRDCLFSPDARTARLGEVALSRLPLDVANWLDLVVGVLYAGGAVAQPGLLTGACERLVRWAQAARKPETALAFSQAAALAEPMSASAALLVGKTAFAFARFHRAHSWLQRATGIGRRVKDWRSYAEAFRWQGELALRAGRYGVADREFKRALKMARRRGNRQEVAESAIGLVRVASEAGRFDEAHTWAVLAARMVRRDPAGEVKLAAASVDLWMWRGEFERALQGLERLRLDASTPERRMLVVARIAHAAAGLGDVARLSETWIEAWELAESRRASSPRQALFDTYLELCRAAGRAGDSGRAARAFRAAAEHASGPADRAALDAARPDGARG